MARRRPPKEITPKELYERWLPEEVAARAKGGAGGAPSEPPLEVRMRVEGEGGGTFDLAIRPGSITPGGGTPDITVTHTMEDWRALVVGDDGGFELLPELPDDQASMAEALITDPMTRQLLSMLNGSLRFELPGYAGRTFATTLHFGKSPPPARPDVTVSIDAAIYKQIIERTLPPAQAWFGGKVRLEGDIGFAMQVGMALLPRFSGMMM